ncbi:MAG: hypothetical protein ACYSUI_06650 [Planctomycetota bacterium]
MLEDGPGSGGGLGRGLFLCKGMAAWMEAWSQCAPQSSPPASHGSLSDNRIPQPLQADVVMVLATMALHNLREMLQ